MVTFNECASMHAFSVSLPPSSLSLSPYLVHPYWLPCRRETSLWCSIPWRLRRGGPSLPPCWTIEVSSLPPPNTPQHSGNHANSHREGACLLPKPQKINWTIYGLFYKYTMNGVHFLLHTLSVMSIWAPFRQKYERTSGWPYRALTWSGVSPACIQL